MSGATRSDLYRRDVVRTVDLQRDVDSQPVDIGQPARARDHRVGTLRRGEVSYPGGHFLATSMATWLRLGGLSEDFFLYAEEADLSVRALRQDLPVIATDAVEVIHEMGGTTGATVDVSRKSPVVLREAARSAMVFQQEAQPLPHAGRRGLPSRSGTSGVAPAGAGGRWRGAPRNRPRIARVIGGGSAGTGGPVIITISVAVLAVSALIALLGSRVARCRCSSCS